jgi:cobalt-zinc-cadmium efflux system outer membrane protein
MSLLKRTRTLSMAATLLAATLLAEPLPACAQAQQTTPLPAAPDTVPTAPLAVPPGVPELNGAPLSNPAAHPGTQNAGTMKQIPPPPPPPADPRKNPPVKPGALTLDQILTLARNDNPTLIAARRNLDAVRAQEIQAGVRQNPNLGITGTDVTLAATNPASPYAYSAQVSRLFERGQKRRWRLDIARATTQQTDAQLRDQVRGTELAVKQAFVAMLIAKASLALSDANLADFRREVTINYDRYTAGDIGKLDIERLDLQLAQFESDQSAAVINLVQASDQLQTLIGKEKPGIGFDIVGDIVPPLLQLDLTALEAKALAARPDYQAALAGVAVAQGNVKLAYADGTADPTLEGEYDRAASYNSAGFNINIPLRLFDRNQGNKKTSEFAEQSSQFTVVAAKNQVYSDVDQAWIGYTQSEELANRYTSHYLDEAGDVLSIAQFAYDHGGLALIDYLDALRDSRSTTADALQAYAATWLAIHQLSYASGTQLVP